jgi:transposase InsO family protein
MIESHAQAGEVRGFCTLLALSESGYYAWRKRELSFHEQEDERLAKGITAIFEESRQTYGAQRLTVALRQRGIYSSRKRVARLMRRQGLVSVRVKKRRIGLTKAAQNAYIAPNLLAQDFTSRQVNEKWVTDTTYIPTKEGWLYLVTVLDLYSRMIVGWAMGEQHDAKLAKSALEMAIQRQKPTEGLLLHSDKGGEFANALYAQTAATAKMQRSMSGTGNCYDNAVTESFFATLKLEAVQAQVYPSHEAARAALFDYIEVFYNRQRLHSSLGFLSPSRFAA